MNILTNDVVPVAGRNVRDLNFMSAVQNAEVGSKRGI